MEMNMEDNVMTNFINNPSSHELMERGSILPEGAAIAA
jgi:hypothetical protein